MLPFLLTNVSSANGHLAFTKPNAFSLSSLETALTIASG